MPKQHRFIKKNAARLGVSFSEYVRQLVSREEEKQTGESPKLDRIVGMFSSGGTDASESMDKQIGKAIEAEHERWQAGA